jgi:hypothetical protein
LCPRRPRDFLFYFEFSFFFGKRGEARGNGPANRGRRRRIASRTISGITFGSPPFFFNLVFEFNLLFEFSFFFPSRPGHNPSYLFIIIECEKRFYYQIIRFLGVQNGPYSWRFSSNFKLTKFSTFKLTKSLSIVSTETHLLIDLLAFGEMLH